MIYIVIAFAYILGSIPFGLVLTRMAGVSDIRKQGSGNIGATNVMRVAGKKLALATLILDGLKGAVAVLLARYLVSEDAALYAALASVGGHMFSLWLGFRGGKGVATTMAVLWVLDWRLGLISALVWLAVFFTTRYSSLAALVTMALTPLVAYSIAPAPLANVVALLGVVVIMKHHQNIKRLLRGEESKSRR